ncbi:E3 ubiquitin-protein ligase ZNRF3 [Zea mays]|uniref:E3 ubiquitin-protein ligase ZNRF3 n=1 Tax=Zea mays TaxID=4577 RepID=A0A3L6EW77_MAIZE|nr:E3 ubiquitin-protein ligase ZNRF3 [Zea mays]
MESPTFSGDNGVRQSADGSSDNEEQEAAADFPEGASSDIEELEGASSSDNEEQESETEFLEGASDDMLEIVRILMDVFVGDDSQLALQIVRNLMDGVAGLEKRVFNSTAEPGRDDGYRGCAICLEDFQDGVEVAVMACSGQHEFHSGCIANWLRRSNTCPMCRHAL